MKLIILAAGRGERLMPLTQNTPKSLLDLGNGLTLLEQQLRSVQRSEVIDEIVLVVGYLAEQIEAKIKAYTKEGLKIRTVFNPFYAQSNNLMSLWMARHEMATDFMVTNGDNLFTPDVFKDFAHALDEGIWLALGKKNEFDPDDMKVTLAQDTIVHVSKQIPDERAHAESPGLSAVIGARARRLYVEELESLARRTEYINRFWLEVYNSLYERGVSVRPWLFETRDRWQEIDFHADCKKLRQLVANQALVL